MDYQEAYKVVEAANKNFDYNFIVTLSDGKRKNKRLFISDCGNLCEFKPRSRKRGTIIVCVDWKSVIPQVRTFDRPRVFTRNLQRIITCLEASKFWPDILESLKNLQGLTGEDVNKWYEMEYRELQQALHDRGAERISVDMFSSMCQKRAIITINWGKWNDWRRDDFLRAIKEHRQYNMSWTNGYDNSVEYNPDGERAWYSEKYRGCANGHYYLLIDEKHAAFREDD